MHSQCLIECGWRDVQALGHPAPQESHARHCETMQRKEEMTPPESKQGKQTVVLGPVLHVVSSERFLRLLVLKKYPKE